MNSQTVLVGTSVTADPPRAAVAPLRRRPARLSLRRGLAHMSPVTWAYIDLLLVALATYLAYTALVFGNSAYRWVVNPWISGTAFCLFVTVSGIIFGLYERSTLIARSRIVVRSVVTILLGVTLGYAGISIVFYGEATRWLGVWVVLLYLALAVPLRVVAHEVITGTRFRVLCVGAGNSIRQLVYLLGRDKRPQYEVVGHVLAASSVPVSEQSRRRSDAKLDDYAPRIEPAAFERECPCLGSTDDIVEIVRKGGIDEIIVDSELAADAGVGAAVMFCLDSQRRVTDQPTFVEKMLGEVPVSHVTPQWFMLADMQTGGSYVAVKRMIDMAASLIGLALTLPFWPLIMLAIRLNSRGPAIFKQRRVGLNGRCFEIFKFRTMRMDAERDGAQWASSNDARVTGLGRFLRKSRIDEIPQLCNILRGDMSLVGPRPERPEFVEELCELIPHYRQRHLVTPGLTGWAQIHYGYGASVADAHRKLCFDLYYLKHRSADLDVAIIFRTIGTFLTGAR
jgi:exopolysaccharide biosynthesis polyprenyl glycosylphosphotransferase